MKTTLLIAGASLFYLVVFFAGARFGAWFALRRANVALAEIHDLFLKNAGKS